MVRDEAATPAGPKRQGIAPPGLGGLDDAVAGSPALPVKCGAHEA